MVSPDESLLAYSVDRTGDEVYELRFRDLETRRRPGRRGAALLLRRRVERRLGVLLLHGARRGLPPVPGLAARPRHVVRRGRAGARRAGRAVRGEGPRDPERRAGRDLVGEPGHHARSGWSTPTEPLDPPRSVGGRRTGVEYHAEHAVLPDGSDALLVVTNDDAEEFRLARCPVPRDADQDHTAWEPVRPEDPARAARAGRRVRDPRRARASAREVRHRLRVLPVDALDSPGFVIDPLLRGRHRRPDAQRGLRRDRRDRRGRVLHPPAGLVGRRPAHRRAHRAAPAATPRTTTRTQYVVRDADLPRPRRHPGAGDARTPPRHPARRHRARPALRVRRLRGRRRPGVGPGAAEPARRAASSSSHAHIRGGGEGGRRWWIDGHLEHKQNTFTDHVAVADGLATASSTAPGSPPAGSAPAGSSRAPCSASARSGGGPSWPRCRSSTSVTTMFDADHPADRHRVGRVGRPASPGGVRLDAGLVAVRQPAAGRLAARPARHRGAARPAGDGPRAGEVGRCPARLRPRVVTALPVPGARPAPAPTPARPAASPVSTTRRRSTPGCSHSLGVPTDARVSNG